MMFSLVIMFRNQLIICCLKYFVYLLSKNILTAWNIFRKNSYDLAAIKIVLICALHLPIELALCHGNGGKGQHSLPHPEQPPDDRWKSGIGQQTCIRSGDGNTNNSRVLDRFLIGY